MNIEVFDTPDSVARRAAEFIAEQIRRVAAERGRFVLAVSGGHTVGALRRTPC